MQILVQWCLNSRQPGKCKLFQVSVPTTVNTRSASCCAVTPHQSRQASIHIFATTAFNFFLHMASLRDFSIRYLNRIGRAIPLTWLAGLTHQRFLLPFYHTISDRKLQHIDHLYRVKNVKEFETDLEFLLRYFVPVDYQRFFETANSKTKLSKPVFLLTFDDGLREFHDIIAPILTRKGIPAVCFVNSAFADNKDLFFKHKASVLVSLLRENNGLQKRSEVKAWMSIHSVRNIASWILSVPYAEKEKLDAFASAIGYDFKEYLDTVRPYLTSAQIEKLIRDGFHFGGHSIDHPEYRLLSYEEQLRQTIESLRYLRETFGINYHLFSFPFTDYGVSNKFFQTIHSDTIVDLSFGGAGIKRERYPFHFQRTAFEREKLTGCDIYKIELIYSALQSVIGKNVIKRI